MKKLTLISTMLLIQTLHAHPSFSGFYVTGGFGGTIGRFDIRHAPSVNAPGVLMIQFPGDAYLQGNNAAGALGAGYSYQFNDVFVLAGEFSAGFTNIEVSQMAGATVLASGIEVEGNIKSTLTNDFALLFKPGLILQKETQLYLLLGARWGNFDTTLDTQFPLANPPVAASDSASGYVVGVTAGVGLQRMISDHWIVGLEYAYTDYSQLPGLNTSANFMAAPGVFVDVSDHSQINVSTHHIMGEVTYLF